MSTKEKVLEKLNGSAGSCVSGEELAELCDVSRAAIWKAINTLRSEGYEINGTTNGGYILSSTNDVFSLDAVRHYFDKNYPQFSGNLIECFDVIDSTNTYAKKLLSTAGNLRNADGALTEAGRKLSNSVFIAEKQTAGRGRSGRTFLSPSKTGIYTTVVYAPQGGITNPARITAFTAVAVCRVLQRLYGVQPSIKWINDIFINGKKMCGILTEGTTNFETGTIEAAVIGFGINIADNPEVFTGDLAKVAGFIESGSTSSVKVNRAELAACTAGEVLKILGENPSEVIKEYKKLSFIIGQEVEVHSLIDSAQGIYRAKAVDIDDEAALVVELADGSRKTLISGEVSLKSSFFAK